METIVPALCSMGGSTVSNVRTERWPTPDGDFLDTIRVHAANSQAPLLVLFHGLEGSACSHYVRSFLQEAAKWGLSFAMPMFRGCSGPINLAPRAYHSGDWAEIDWVLRRLKDEKPDRPLMSVGVSLGGNALTLWAAKRGDEARSVVDAVAAISAPLDLSASGDALGQGFNRIVYTKLFLGTMKKKACAKWHQYPGLFDLDQAMAAGTLREFDDAFTAPVHGFNGVDDYWQSSSAKPWLQRLRVPTLLLNATNDPFVPAHSLPTYNQVSDAVELLQPPTGGHVGFARASGLAGLGFDLQAMPSAVLSWLIEKSERRHHDMG